jgi:integrase
VVIHHEGRRRKRRYGPLQRDEDRALKDAAKIGAQITAGAFEWKEDGGPLPAVAELRAFLKHVQTARRPSTVSAYGALIETHLGPFLGSRDLRTLERDDLVAFVEKLQAKGRKRNTIRNALRVLQRACSLLVRDGKLDRNPVAHLGDLLPQSTETEGVLYWSRAEVETLLAMAEEHEPRLAPLLRLAFGTGMRLGELAGAHWEDFNAARMELHVRRSFTHGAIGKPKTKKSTRHVQLAPGLVRMLLDLREQRRREQIEQGWREVPQPIFCTIEGTYDTKIEGVWLRLRRRDATRFRRRGPRAKSRGAGYASARAERWPRG